MHRSDHPRLRLALGIGFIAAGLLHFLRPRGYVHIVPDWLPNHAALVAISGVAELAGGVGLLAPPLRQPAGIGLLALLVAVFPANVEMFVHHDTVAPKLPLWALAARLPLQPALMYLVWLAYRRPD